MEYPSPQVARKPTLYADGDQPGTSPVQKLEKYYAFMLWIVLAAVIGYSILLPLGEDLVESLAWADVARLQGGFPHNIEETWLSRGIGYKVIMYAVADLSRVFAGDAPRLRIYIFNTLLIVLCVALIGCALLVIRARGPGEPVHSSSSRDRAEAMALGILIFLPATTWAWAQPSHLSVLLAGLGICLAFSPSKLANWGSGVTLVVLFTLKGVTALYFLFVLGATIAAGDRSRIHRVVTSATVATVAIAVAYFTFLRADLNSLLLAAQFQQTTGPAQWLGKFVIGAVPFGLYSPAVPFGLVAFAILMFRNRSFLRKEVRLAILVVGAWLISLLIILVQTEFRGSHYQSFVPAAYFSLFVLYIAHGGKLPDLMRPFSAPAVTKMLIVAICCIDGVMVGVALLPISARSLPETYSFAKREERLACFIQSGQAIRQIIRETAPVDSSNIEVFNLTKGALSYGLQLRSASRFFFPLPLWLGTPSTEAGRELLEQASTYKGTFIVAPANLSGLEGYSLIEAHLRADYRPVSVQTPCADVQVWKRAG